jgi:hypothetical protein
MAEHAASAAAAAAAGLRAQAAVRVGNAAPAQRYWRSDRRAFCDSTARDHERTTICR